MLVSGAFEPALAPFCSAELGPVGPAPFPEPLLPAPLDWAAWAAPVEADEAPLLRSRQLSIHCRASCFCWSSLGACREFKVEQGLGAAQGAPNAP